MTQEKKFHEGETPIDTFLDEETGVTKEAYETPNFTTFGAGTWDSLGTEKWIMNGNNDSRQVDGVYSSGRGDYMVRVPAHIPSVIN